jgi:choline kinase
MRGLILAAGRGSRLGALTRSRPKCLLEVRGRSLLDHQISALQSAGISDIAIVRGYCGAQLDGRGVAMIDNPDWGSSNICASLITATGWLSGHCTVVSYADILYSAAAVASLRNTPGDITILYDPSWLSLWGRRMSDPMDDAESFSLNSAGSVDDIGGRASKASEISGRYVGLFKLTSLGFELISRQFHDLPPQARATVDMTGIFCLLIRRGIEIHAAPISSSWMEVDTPADLALCEEMAATGELHLDVNSAGARRRGRRGARLPEPFNQH